MIGTVLGQIAHKDTTRPIDKLRKQIRRSMLVKTQKAYDEQMAVAQEADRHWIATQEKLGSELRVTTTASLNSLYDLMSPEQKFIKPKLFDSAIRSIEAKSEESDWEVENTKNAYMLTQFLRESLGIEDKRPSLGLLRKKILKTQP